MRIRINLHSLLSVCFHFHNSNISYSPETLAVKTYCLCSLTKLLFHSQKDHAGFHLPSLCRSSPLCQRYNYISFVFGIYCFIFLTNQRNKLKITKFS
eukprot:UN24467